MKLKIYRMRDCGEWIELVSKKNYDELKKKNIKFCLKLREEILSLQDSKNKVIVRLEQELKALKAKKEKQ